MPNRTAKIKITYLVPAQWSAEEVVTSLPLHILKLSELPVENVRLQVKADSIWGEPRLKGLAGATTEWTESGRRVFGDEPGRPKNMPIKLAIDAPLE